MLSRPLLRFFFILLLLFSFFSNAQKTGGLEFLTQSGEQFKIFLNGKQIHQGARTNVEVKGLYAMSYQLRVEFKDSNIRPIERNLYIKAGHKLIYSIGENSFGRYDLEPLTKTDMSKNSSSSSSGNDVSSGHSDATGQSVSVNVTVSSSDSSLSTKVVAKTSAGGNASDGNIDPGSDGKASGKSDGASDPLPDYDGPTGCQGVMNKDQFQKAKSSLKDKSFAKSKMKQAKRLAADKCLLTDQVKWIVESFEFEQKRLEFAKFAYDHTYDQGNYYRIHDSFDFSSSIDELESHLKKK